MLLGSRTWIMGLPPFPQYRFLSQTERMATPHAKSLRRSGKNKHSVLLVSLASFATLRETLLLPVDHFIECRASRFPSVSSQCAMNPYSPMLFFGSSVFPPFAFILRKVSSISSTLKYTTVPACDGS